MIVLSLLFLSHLLVVSVGDKIVVWTDLCSEPNQSFLYS